MASSSDCDCATIGVDELPADERKALEAALGGTSIDAAVKQSTEVLRRAAEAEAETETGPTAALGVIRVREVRPETDAPHIVELYNACYTDEACQSISGVRKFVRKALTVKDLGDLHTNYVAPTGCCAWVATRGDAIVGFVGVQPNRDPGSHTAGSGTIRHLSVDPRCRRQGVARLLLERVHEWCGGRYQHLIACTLSVHPEAAATYAACGYTQVDEFVQPLYSILVMKRNL